MSGEPGEPGEFKENKKHPKKSGRSQGESLFYPKVREIEVGSGRIFVLGSPKYFYTICNLRAFLAKSDE